jgi:hypothetical protein
MRDNVSVSTEAPTDGPLSEAEFRTFTGLLRRFCEYELDQWDNWRYRTTFGYVYISISRKEPEGHPPGAHYDEIPQPDSGG